jgi:hypothetical protein
MAFEVLHLCRGLWFVDNRKNPSRKKRGELNVWNGDIIGYRTEQNNHKK